MFALDRDQKTGAVGDLLGKRGRNEKDLGSTDSDRFPIKKQKTVDQRDFPDPIYWSCSYSYPFEVINLTFAQLSLSHFFDCSLVCNHWSKMVAKFFSQIDLDQCQKLSNGRLLVLDKHKLKLRLEEELIESIIEPEVNPLALLKQVILFSPYLKDEKGFTLLTVPEHLTINKCMEIFQNKKIAFLMEPLMGEFNLPLLRSFSVDTTYRVLIINDLFLNTDKMSIEQENDEWETKGWKRLTLLESLVFILGSGIAIEKESTEIARIAPAAFWWAPAEKVEPSLAENKLVVRLKVFSFPRDGSTSFIATDAFSRV